MRSENTAIKQPLPLGSASFETLREANEIYVDKTEMIYNLACQRRKIFLSRPRRFGKSLLISTFESLFKHGLKYFNGLAIEQLWQDSKTYSTIRLDFSNLKDFSSLQEFRADLNEYFIDLMDRENIQGPTQTQSEGLRAFINWLAVQPNNSVVLLIDEYDAPLTACLNDPVLFKSVRRVLSRLYSAVKTWEGKLRFFFMTGIMKFGKASIFSELNNLTDISLSPQYGTLLGYTHEEVLSYFSEYLDEAANVLRTKSDKLLSRLAEQYDGFCFEETASAKVFAPWSLLSFFSEPKRGLKNYWVDSAGNPSVLQQYLKDHGLREPHDYFDQKFVSIPELEARTTKIENINDTILLVFAGYLTIKNAASESFLVGYPNKEVSDSLALLYREKLLAGKTLDQLGAFHIKDDILSGNADRLLQQLNRLFLVMDYRKYPITDETACRNYTQLMLTLGGDIKTYSELHNALGRSDIEVDTPNAHWVFEIKFMPSSMNSEAAAQRLLNEALAQIKKNHYGESYALSKKLIRIAFVFSEKARQIIKHECMQ